MDNRIMYPKPIQPLRPAQTPINPKSAPQKGKNPAATPFQNVLEAQLGPTLKFSQHAQQRLATRNIHLGGEELQRIAQGVEKVAEKGARDSLVLLDQLALVVSVQNRTVITAVDEAHLKENVFTNIDSAVIV